MKEEVIFTGKNLDKYSTIIIVERGGSVVNAVRPEGCRFESHSSRHVETLDKSFACS